jgi:hypothetical protein
VYEAGNAGAPLHVDLSHEPDGDDSQAGGFEFEARIRLAQIGRSDDLPVNHRLSIMVCR